MKLLRVRHLVALLCVTACTTAPEPTTMAPPTPTVSCTSCQAIIARVHADVVATTTMDGEDAVGHQHRCGRCRSRLSFYEQDGMLMVASTAEALPIPCGPMQPSATPTR